MKPLKTKTSAKKEKALPGVTAIKSVKNDSHDDLYLRSTEMDHGFDVRMGASSAIDIWIPHAQNERDFEAHHLRLENPRGQTRFVMWQSRRSGQDRVYCADGARYKWPAPEVRGEARAEGNRYMIYEVEIHGTLLVTLYALAEARKTQQTSKQKSKTVQNKPRRTKPATTRKTSEVR